VHDPGDPFFLLSAFPWTRRVFMFSHPFHRGVRASFFLSGFCSRKAVTAFLRLLSKARFHLFSFFFFSSSAQRVSFGRGRRGFLVQPG